MSRQSANIVDEEKPIRHKSNRKRARPYVVEKRYTKGWLSRMSPDMCEWYKVGRYEKIEQAQAVIEKWKREDAFFKDSKAEYRIVQPSRNT